MAISTIQNSREVQQQNPESQKASRTGIFADVMKSVSESPTTLKEKRISSAVVTASQKYNLPPELILGVIKQESGFKPCAESQCGAQGLMQLMPETAKDLGVKDSLNIEQNIDGGSRYLKQMLDQFGGDTKLALAAYNAGPSNVQKYGGIPPFEETQNYVRSVLSHTQLFNGSLNTAVSQDTNALQPVDPEQLTLAMANSVISATPLELPKVDRKVEEPPPPPPYAVRV